MVILNDMVIMLRLVDADCSVCFIFRLRVLKCNAKSPTSCLKNDIFFVIDSK